MSIRPDGSGTATFKVPGGFEGVLLRWGRRQVGLTGVIIKDSKITIAGAELNVSKTEVLPNETITITGNGFGTGRHLHRPAANITLDNVPVMVDDSTANGGACDDMVEVEVSNSGQFVATIILWPQWANGRQPDPHPRHPRVERRGQQGVLRQREHHHPEPTVMVTPDVAGPRDYITITGENWPVDNPEGSEYRLRS